VSLVAAPVSAVAAPLSWWPVVGASPEELEHAANASATSDAPPRVESKELRNMRLNAAAHANRSGKGTVGHTICGRP
jgi:hypothetical protein